MGSYISNIATGTGTVTITQTAHGLPSAGDAMTVKIERSNCTPSIDGYYLATRVDANSYTISATVTVAGTFGIGRKVWFADPEGSAGSANGRNFSNRVQYVYDLGSTSPAQATGDFIKVKASYKASLGQNATFTLGSKTVTLTTAVTQTLHQCNSAMTSMNGNVTCSTDATNFKYSSASATIAIGASFTTGDAAYIATGSSLDLSSYQKLCFWIRSDVAVTANYLQIITCSNADGTGDQDTLNVPGINGTGQWTLMVIDKGSALYNGVQSFKVKVATDFGAANLKINCVIAATATGLHLGSLIGLDGTGIEQLWYPIQSIDGTTILLDGHVQATGAQGRGASCDTQTDTLYYINPARGVGSLTYNGASNVFRVPAAGTANTSLADSNYVDWSTVSGGWNRTDMSTRSAGELTFWDGINGWGNVSGMALCAYEYIGAARVNVLEHAYAPAVITDIHVVATTSIGYLGSSIASGSSRWSTGNAYCSSCADGISVAGMWSSFTLVEGSSISRGVGVFGGGTFKDWVLKNNGSYNVALYQATPAWLDGLTTSNGATASLRFESTGKDESEIWMTMKGVSIAETTEVSPTNNGTLYLLSYDHEGSGVHYIWTRDMTVTSETTTRHTASGFAWKLANIATAGTQLSAASPWCMNLATFDVSNGVSTTITLWTYRGSTDFNIGLRVRGGQVAGVASDVVDWHTGAATTWEQQSVNFTPSADGVVSVEVVAYCNKGTGGSYYAIIDDLEIPTLA